MMVVVGKAVVVVVVAKAVVAVVVVVDWNCIGNVWWYVVADMGEVG